MLAYRPGQHYTNVDSASRVGWGIGISQEHQYIWLHNKGVGKS